MQEACQVAKTNSAWGSQVLYAYSDNNGNLYDIPVHNTDIIHATYDTRNRLTKIDNYTTDIFVAEYDSENNRIFTNDTQYGPQYHLIDPHGGTLSRHLESYTYNNGFLIQTTYIHGHGLLYQINPDGTAIYYHYDHNANTIALTNDEGETTDTFQYTPYGQLTHDTGTTPTRYQYAGQLGVQTDPTGLLYMRARYYSPTIKRFINADPIQFAGGMNWFAYAKGNPIRYVDPLGLCSQTVSGSGIGLGSPINLYGITYNDLAGSHDPNLIEFRNNAPGGSFQLGGNIGGTMFLPAGPSTLGAGVHGEFGLSLSMSSKNPLSWRPQISISGALMVGAGFALYGSGGGHVGYSSQSPNINSSITPTYFHIEGGGGAGGIIAGSLDFDLSNNGQINYPLPKMGSGKLGVGAGAYGAGGYSKGINITFPSILDFWTLLTE